MEQIDLTKFLPGAAVLGSSLNRENPFMVQGVSIDSRTIQPGDLFVAIRGEHLDGHQFVKQAVQKGAVACVIDKAGEAALEHEGFFKIVVKDTLSFLMDLAAWYRAQFTIPVIAITGSTGKTTSKELLASVLAQKFRVTKTTGNMNNFYGVPLTIFKISGNTQYAILEVGTNHQGEIAALTEIVKPTHAAITNIGSGHIGFFGSREAIYREKKALFDLMPVGGTIYLNWEDSFLRSYLHTGMKIRKCGFGSDADFRVSLLETDKFGRVRFNINSGVEITLKIPGRHHLMNGVLAAAIGLDLGLSPETVKTGIEAVDAISKRMQVFEDGGVLFINDAYNSNPESLKAAIDYLCELQLPNGARRFAVIGDMLELGEQSEALHREIGEYLATKPVDFVFNYGNESRAIVEVLASQNTHASEGFNDYQAIAAALQKELKPGDAVLIKASRGMALEKVFDYLKMGKEIVR